MRIINIPNILLQESKDIIYYLVESGKTIKEGFFPVNNREKPSEVRTVTLNLHMRIMNPGGSLASISLSVKWVGWIS